MLCSEIVKLCSTSSAKMATDLLHRGVFFVGMVLLLSSYAAAQSRPEMCVHLRKCYTASPICIILFHHIRCIELLDNRHFPSTYEEDTCGMSSMTGDTTLFVRNRILGSIDAIQNELPWMIHLDDSRSVFSRCGGVVIGRRSVLTAAHCVTHLVIRPDDLRVGYGSVNLTSLKYVHVKRIAVHPDYNSTNRDNDIAVITLNEALPLDYTPNIRSICLPERRLTYEAASCIIAGWGLTEDGGNQFPETLKWAAVPTVPIKECKPAYEDFPGVLVSLKQLCAGFNIHGGVDACLGDSGGPLICARGKEWVVYGIVSTGNRCGLPGFPGVYAYVPQHVSWIESQMN